MRGSKRLCSTRFPRLKVSGRISQALDDFFRWCGAEAIDGFNKATVNAYRANLESRHLSSSTINQRRSAIRKLAMEAADNGFMPPEQAAAISRMKGPKQSGVRTGHWRTREQAERLISGPDSTTLKGARDRSLLAVVIGCGLRCGEAATLSVEHVQLRDARWVIVDLIGRAGESVRCRCRVGPNTPSTHGWQGRESTAALSSAAWTGWGA